jgi:hypothetical protein
VNQNTNNRVTSYRAMTRQGAEVDVAADTPLEGMQAAAGRCAPDDYPVVLYSLDAQGRMVEPAWGGRRGLGGAFPEGESPQDAARMFGPGGEPA